MNTPNWDKARLMQRNDIIQQILHEIHHNISKQFIYDIVESNMGVVLEIMGFQSYG